MAGVLLTALTTLNYRNLEAATLNFPAGVTGIWGQNGAGKTNLLEAAYLALTGLTDAPAPRGARAGRGITDCP